MTTIDEQHGYIRNLKVERAGLVQDIRELVDRPKRENRSLEGDERSQLDRVEGRISDLDEQINSWESRIAYERKTTESRAPFNGLVRPPSSSSSQDYEQRAVRSMFKNPGKYEERTLNETTTTAGGDLVPTTLYTKIREYLVQLSAVWQLNANVIQTTSGEPLAIPTNPASGTAAIVGEGTGLATSDPTFGQVVMHSFKYGRLLQITNELLQDNVVDVVQFIAKEGARALSLGYGADFTSGNGTNKPQGWMNGITTGTTSQTAATGVPSYDDVVTLVYSVPMQYRMAGCQFVAADSAVAALRKITTTTGWPLWSPNVEAGVPDEFMGYPVVTDPHMTALGTAAGTSVAFGDWSGWYLRDVGIRIDVSPEYAFNADITTYRVIQRLDSRWVDQSGVRSMVSPSS